jgi:hypothetical protein
MARKGNVAKKIPTKQIVPLALQRKSNGIFKKTCCFEH